MKSPTSTAGSGITVGGVTPEEDQHLRALGDALAVVPGWEYLDSQPSGAWRVEAGSDLAGDDAAIHPYPVSSAARTAISAGICRGRGSYGPRPLCGRRHRADQEGAWLPGDRGDRRLPGTVCALGRGGDLEGLLGYRPRDMRGMAAYLTIETIGHAAPGILLNRVTANIELTVTGTLAALATTRTALDLYARRAGRHG